MATPLTLDIYKLKRRPGWIFLAVFLLLALKGSVYMASKFGAFGGIENGFAFLGLSANYSLFLASFLLCILGSASISGEYTSGILRMHLARPVSRGTYYLQHLFFLSFIALFFLFLDGFVGSLVGWGGFGFSDVADPNLQGLQFSAHAMAWASMKGYLFTFLGMAGIVSTGLLISVLVRSPTAAIGVGTAAYFSFEGISLLFREPASNYMITSYIRVHMNHLSKLARGIAEYQAPDFAFKALVVPVGYILLANALGYFFFKRMDVLE